jgi:hypothetical protein
MLFSTASDLGACCRCLPRAIGCILSVAAPQRTIPVRIAIYCEESGSLRWLECVRVIVDDVNEQFAQVRYS